MYAGDERYSDAQTAPELEDNPDAFDPLDNPCDECGAEPGEACRPFCIAASE